MTTPRKRTAFDAEKENRGSSSVPGEEGIQVAIRMRPLNNKEADGRRVWRVLQKYNSIAQTTPHGKPLPDRAIGKTFFTFDKTFGEDSTTTQVYNDVVHGIASSTVSGLNGTIFAYGQTSSGKTFTMMGGGLKQPGVHGIIQMAAKDMFSQIEANPTRVFLLRVSFIEIYNEEVKDLLVSGVRKIGKEQENRRPGVYDNANESVVTDLETLASILYAGVKHRSVESTERSSQCHTIFRITLESRRRKETTDDDNGNESYSEDETASCRRCSFDDDEAVRVSTLNFVDLAGSESAQHTGATGERQKEGDNNNQSLLTLSGVIASLAQPGSTHIDFHDSMLTRILQPSLSGNARMAVICCATPSELYLEETRSTLQFASLAKLIKTKPQVNEVLDDSSFIKSLQKELAEATKFGVGKENYQHMQDLNKEAPREVEEKLRQVRACFLKGGVLPVATLGKTFVCRSEPKDQAILLDNGRNNRRRSDTCTKAAKLQEFQMTPERTRAKKNEAASASRISDEQEVENEKLICSSGNELLRDALQLKGQKCIDHQVEISSLSNDLERAQIKVTSALEQNLSSSSMIGDDPHAMGIVLVSEYNSTIIAKSEIESMTKLSEKDMQLENLIDENSKMNQRLKELEITIKHLTYQGKKAEAAKKKQEDTVNQQCKQIDRLQLELDQAVFQNSVYKGAMEGMEKEVANLEHIKENLEEQIQSLNAHAEVTDADTRVNEEKSLSKINELLQTVNLKNADIDRLLAHFDEALTASEVSTEAILAIQAKLEEATAENETLHSRLLIAAEEREQAAADLQTTKASFEEQIQDITSVEDESDNVYLGVMPTVTDDCSSSCYSESEESLPQVENYAVWKVTELREALKALGLKTSGKKAELINRLKIARK